MHKQHGAVIREMHSFVRKHRINRLGAVSGRTPLVIFQAEDVDRLDELAKLEIDLPLRLPVRCKWRRWRATNAL